MRCKKHSTDLSSSVGVCATCLRHRLSELVIAQSQSQSNQQFSHSHQPPPLLFPRSVSPYHTSHPHLRFHSTPQQLPTSTPHFTTTGSFPNSNKKFSFFSSFFRRKKQPTVYSVEFPGRRNHKPSDRGMSPVTRDPEYDDCDRSASGSGCSSESPERCKKTPTSRRGKHGRNASGLAFCLSPLVRASPNRNWSNKTVGGIPPDIGFNGKVNGKPHLSSAASYCANRSRKLADFGRVNRNR